MIPFSRSTHPFMAPLKAMELLQAGSSCELDEAALRALPLEHMQRLYAGLKAAASAAGAIRHSLSLSDWKVAIKPDGSQVTPSDKASSEAIAESLADSGYHSDSRLDEESEPYRGASEWTWVIDPIDGTREFIRGGSEFGIHIAVFSGYEPLIGVNYYPATDQLYWAVKGCGAYSIDSAGKLRRLHSSSLPSPYLSLMAPTIGDSADASLVEAILAALMQKEIIQGTLAVGSVGLKACYLANGLHAIWLMTPRRSLARCGLWDFASGQVILREAGGVLMDCRGRALDYRGELRWGILMAPHKEAASMLVDQLASLPQLWN